MKTCCFCGKIIRGYGNNAQPLKEGVCCDICNVMKVLPHRLRLASEERREKRCLMEH